MKILFGLTDWGLGHATRDLPLIKALLKNNHKVDIVSTGRALTYLKSELGRKCRFFDIPGIKAPYPKHAFLITHFLFHIPRMLNELRIARKQFEEILAKNKYDRVISDCRFEIYDKKENSFLINHQLKIAHPPYAFPVTWFLISNANKNFGTVIVPDFPKRTLTKDFSDNSGYKIPVKYIGIVSHVEKKNLKEDIDYFITISGPEPQRTIFEEKIFKQIGSLNGNIVIALGKPEDKRRINKKGVKIYGFLNSKEQEEMINRAKFIISRPGYTTIMDLIELDKKKALFVPTPGQPEQEYIADLYENERFFFHIHQSKLDLINNIFSCKKFKGFNAPWKTRESVNFFLKAINL